MNSLTTNAARGMSTQIDVSFPVGLLLAGGLVLIGATQGLVWA